MSQSLRRTVLKRCGLAAAAPFVRDHFVPTVSGQDIKVQKEMRASVAKDLRFFRVLALSNDGRRMALLATSPGSARTSIEKAPVNRKAVTPKSNRIQVVDTHTWVRLGESQNSGNSTTNVSFFADSQSIYCESVKSGTLIREILGPDMQTVLGDKVPFWDDTGRHTSLVALSGHHLLGLEMSIDFGTEAISLVSAEGWATVKRVALFQKLEASNKRARITGAHLSLDRRFFAQAIDMDVLFRSSADLALAWRRKWAPGWSPIRLGVSVTGEFVAVGLEQSSHRANEHPGAVTVVAGRDGSIINHFRVDGIEGVAISPDGKLVAVGERIQLDETVGDTQITVNIYDASSGNLVAKLEHDRLRVAPGRGADGSLSYYNGLHFTPDGSRLISSGLHTKVWKLSSE